MCSEAGMARQGKLKRQDGSGVNAIAAKTSVNVSLSSFHDKPCTSLGLCVAQAILKETPELRIRNRNNQRHILLQRYACKCVRLKHKASGLHNSWIFCSILPKCNRNYLRRSEIQNILGNMPPCPPCGRTMHAFMRSAYCWKARPQISA